MRGRTKLLFGLLGFFLLATGVIWRRSTGLARARELRALEQRRTALEATEAALEAEIRKASSQAQLARLVEERLGLRVPAESLVIRLPRSTPGSVPP